MHPYPITKARSQEIATITAIDLNTLERVSDTLSQSDEYAIAIEDYVLLLSEFFDQSSAEALSSFTLGMRRNIERHSLTVAELLDSVTAGLADADWKPEQLDKWSKRRPYLEALVDSRYVRVVEKSSELYYLHHEHIHNLRITTDLRPIFDDDRSAVISYIVKNELHVVISDSNEFERMVSVPIGVESMVKLKRELDNAIKKTEIMIEEIKATKKVPPRVYRAME